MISEIKLKALVAGIKLRILIDDGTLDTILEEYVDLTPAEKAIVKEAVLTPVVDLI